MSTPAPRRARRRRPAAAVALGLGGALALVLLLGLVDAGPALRAAEPLAAPARVAPAVSTTAVQAALQAPPDLARAASLQGTDWDGDWSLDPASGEPRPSLRLRQRFDHGLSQLGERPLAVLRAQLQARMAADALRPASQQALLRLFDAYTAVGQHPYRVQVDPREPHTWQAALAERQTVRRQHLGWAWAEAFFGEEERALLSTLAQLRGEAATPAEPEPARHPQAAAREAAAEAAWADWERRLGAARRQWQLLQQAASLSAPQREAAWQAHLQQHFDAAEQLRVQALVQVPP